MKAKTDTKSITTGQQSKLKSIFSPDVFKRQLEQSKFEKLWSYRNYEHGEVFTNTLELDFVHFDDNIFVEDSVELRNKLNKIGFEILNSYPGDRNFKDFSVMFYNKKHNLAISLYPSKYQTAIQIAQDVVKNSKIDGDTSVLVFTSTINALVKHKEI